uniref:Retrovirus-related Pol polyprotein from type-1 retrotransposable element R2 n=1 Tax=Sipha flava TaxID=143950 RepID=A0A2S2Q3M8_9HEMI
MINSLKEFNLPHKLISLIETSITDSFVKIKVEAAETEPIQVKSGLRQGDSISPILFNLILEKVVREMNIQPQEGFKLQESAVALVAYAVDVVLMSNSHHNLKSLFIQLEKMAKKLGL